MQIHATVFQMQTKADEKPYCFKGTVQTQLFLKLCIRFLLGMTIVTFIDERLTFVWLSLVFFCLSFTVISLFLLWRRVRFACICSCCFCSVTFLEGCPQLTEPLDHSRGNKIKRVRLRCECLQSRMRLPSNSCLFQCLRTST